MSVQKVCIKPLEGFAQFIGNLGFQQRKYKRFNSNNFIASQNICPKKQNICCCSKNMLEKLVKLSACTDETNDDLLCSLSCKQFLCFFPISVSLEEFICGFVCSHTNGKLNS